MREAGLADHIEMLIAMTEEKVMALDLVTLAESFGITVEDLRAQIKKARETMPQETEAEDIADPFPEFPKLFGPVHDLAELIGPSLAYSHKVLHLLTCLGLHLSGRVTLATDPWLQSRFFAAMVGPPGSTKSAVDKEVRGTLFPRALEQAGEIRYRHAPLLSDIAVEFSINSGPALTQAFEDNPTGKVLIASDELSSLFEKARTTTASPNSLHGEFLRLYESNEIGRRVVQNRKRDKKTGEILEDPGKFTKITNAKLAIIAGATDKSFEGIWTGTGGAASGLQSRFSLSYSTQMLPPFQVLMDEQRAADTLGELMRVLAKAADSLVVSELAQKEVTDWVERQAGEIPPRVLDTAKRAAIVLASCDQTSEVTGAVMRWCLAFADYQVQLKARLMPADASSDVQAFENRILAFVLRHKQASGRQIVMGINPSRYPGGYVAFERATQALTRSGALVSVGKTRAGKHIWRLG